MFQEIFNMLIRFSKGFSADRVRAVFAVCLCIFLFACGGVDERENASLRIEEKTRKAAGYFLENFALFIPDGYTAAATDTGERDGFISGTFVILSPQGEEADILPVPFLLTRDGRHLIIGAEGPLDAADYEQSDIPGFKTAPDSFRRAPVVLISPDGQMVAASRIMDLSVDYAERNMRKISLKHAPVLGDPDAEVVLVEFSDFQCPYCGDARQILREILSEFEGSVKLVYKQFPLSFHEWAYKASEASYCFRKYGGDEAFWRFHDEVFANQRAITEDNHREQFAAIAEGAGLDSQKILLCMHSGEMKNLVDRDISEGHDLKVSGTPGFFVDGGRVPNDPDLLKKAISLRLSRKN